MGRLPCLGDLLSPRRPRQDAKKSRGSRPVFLFSNPSSKCAKRELRAESIRADLKLEGMEPIGTYAVQLAWSDGHSSGLFTWETLRQLAGRIQGFLGHHTYLRKIKHGVPGTAKVILSRSIMRVARRLYRQREAPLQAVVD